MFQLENYRLLAAISTLLILSACGKPSEKLLSDRLKENNDQIVDEMCDALGSTARFDVAARRGIMKDYDIPQPVMVEIETKITENSMGATMCSYYALVAVINYERGM